jgi:hypothetical protein
MVRAVVKLPVAGAVRAGMLRRFSHLAAALASGLTFASCTIPVRAADDVSQTRSVSGFDRIRLDGAFSATVTAGKHDTRFVMTGDPDVLARVTTKVSDGLLVVGMRDGDNHLRGTIKLQIDLPVLRSFKIAGVGNANISGLTGADLELAVPGAASITASGRAGNETLSLDGTGKIDASDVAARDVTASANGVGAIYVQGSGSMVLSVNGVGEIRYKGNPTNVVKHVNGLGRISAM